MSTTVYKRDDFSNGAEVRWCPGCGDYAILMAVQRLLAELGVAPEKHVFISGIGCAGRLPYYMNTYGFHTIHGRATAVATGLKAMRADLTVWVVTGDGDALSIGGNHLIHCLRRNVNVNILLFNNQVYGLTKGQFSPTSQRGQITKTSPKGVEQEPINPLMLALSAGAGFVARAVDKDPSHLSAVLKQAFEHPGCSFTEIYQDCNIFNHGVFDQFALKEHRANQTILLEDGRPLIFGKNKEWALAEEGGCFKKVPYDNNGSTPYCHDVHSLNAALSLCQLHFPLFPVPLGVYFQQHRDTYHLDNSIVKDIKDLASLYRGKATWQAS